MVDIIRSDEGSRTRGALNRLTYEAGDDEKFRQYANQIQSKPVCDSIKRIRIWLKMNSDPAFVKAYKLLEKLVADDRTGTQNISPEDYVAWEMMGRAYEVIADRNSPKNNSKGNPDISIWASARAMNCYARAEKDARDRRVRRTYAKSLIKELMGKLRKIIANKCPEKGLEQIIINLPTSAGSSRS